MSKVLSVCVPSYNMEKYLNRCIDSFLVPEVLDRLELIIVNDGSTDNTLSIANEYKTKFPQTIVVIDKPNGHYGSCVNASLKVATGKYFRIVDADDWVDSNALVTFINKLENIDVDCVCTKHTVHDLNESNIRVQTYEATFETPLNMNEIDVPIECLFMHDLSYSTQLLKLIEYDQTEGICYTDNEYVYFPLSCSKNILFLDISLYQYYIGRDTQSMAPEVLRKNYNHFVIVLNKIYNGHGFSLPFNTNEKRIWINFLSGLSFRIVPMYLLFHKYDKKTDNLLRLSILQLRKEEVGLCEKLFDSTVLKIPYVSIWFSLPFLSKHLFPIMHLLRWLTTKINHA